ncbi:CsbD family protein [Streptomyces sp. NRRL F-5135]|uniref:CsbD family protein n=1 Tax=Streptomyces sp. NRRL F-5135 TaxID=1463858 RepID=UPI0004C57CCD|nr:CsbD family protein [Streptomyces sp. NRRL F-5135]
MREDDSAMDKAKGKAKEAAGKLTGDRRTEAEGRTDQAKGKTKDTMRGAKERAKGAKDSLTDD